MPSIGKVIRDVYRRPGADAVPSHLQVRHGIRMESVTALAPGVLRVDRRDGPPWVAGAHLLSRPLSTVEDDVQLLRLLADAGFPAEQCAGAKPVSAAGSLHQVPGYEGLARTGCRGRLRYACRPGPEGCLPSSGGRTNAESVAAEGRRRQQTAGGSHPPHPPWVNGTDGPDGPRAGRSGTGDHGDQIGSLTAADAPTGGCISEEAIRAPSGLGRLGRARLLIAARQP